MAGLTQVRAPPGDIGGKHLQGHKLVHDTPSVPRHNDQRSSTDGPVQGNIRRESTNGEVATEGDDEDSSAGQADEQDDEEDDAEVSAPSRGYGKGKGKRPIIRVEPAGGEDESHDESDTASRGTGLSSKHLASIVLNENKKRTFSNVSDTSLLFGEDATPRTFPRPKVARTLSQSGDTGLLTYKAANDEAAGNFENAIDSSDDERDVDEPNLKSTDDDEDYSALNQISDDDSDIEKVEQEEESFIINDELDFTTNMFADSMFPTPLSDARRLSLDSYASGPTFDLFTELPGETYDPLAFGMFFENRERSPISSTTVDPLPHDQKAKRKMSDTSTKKVRFDDEVHVSEDTDTDSSELYDIPDLFMSQDKLPASLTQLMELDRESDADDLTSISSERSFWEQSERHNDMHNEPYTFQTHDYDESSEAGSSGYETDMGGDTTDGEDSDAELPSAPQTPRQKSVLNRPSSAPASRAATPRPFQRSTNGRGIGPIRGVFIHEDSRQAIAVTNRKTKTLTFYRPRTTVSQGFSAFSSATTTANNSPRASTTQLNMFDSDFVSGSLNAHLVPMSSTADIMFAGLSGSTSDFLPLGGDSIGPPEAFYPFISIEDGNVLLDDSDYEDDEDFEDDINLADFMDFGSDGDDASDGEQGEETDVPATPATSMIVFNGSTPAQPTPMAETPLAKKRTTTSDAMLEHFDRAGVTAFRNNQNRFRDIASLPHDPNLRASVSRPIRSGKAADTLMSPLRKRSSMSKKMGKSTLGRVGKSTSRLQPSLMNRGPPRMGTFS